MGIHKILQGNIINSNSRFDSLPSQRISQPLQKLSQRNIKQEYKISLLLKCNQLLHNRTAGLGASSSTVKTHIWALYKEQRFTLGVQDKISESLWTLLNYCRHRSVEGCTCQADISLYLIVKPDWRIGACSEQRADTLAGWLRVISLTVPRNCRVSVTQARQFGPYVKQSNTSPPTVYPSPLVTGLPSGALVLELSG